MTYKKYKSAYEKLHALGCTGSMSSKGYTSCETEDDGSQHRRGLVLLVSPENLPEVGLEWSLPNKTLKFGE